MEQHTNLNTELEELEEGELVEEREEAMEEKKGEEASADSEILLRKSLLCLLG